MNTTNYHILVLVNDGELYSLWKGKNPIGYMLYVQDYLSRNGYSVDEYLYSTLYEVDSYWRGGE